MSGVLVFDPRELISAFDQRVLQWLRQRHGPRLTRAMRAVTELGSLPGLAAVVSGSAFILQRRNAILVASAATGAGVLSEALKLVFGRRRPERALRLAKTFGFAFPSGHSAASTATYGAIALLFASHGHRWIARVFATLVPASVGASRVYLHVHFPSDVVVGWALGAGWLSIVSRLARAPR